MLARVQGHCGRAAMTNVKRSGSRARWLAFGQRSDTLAGAPGVTWWVQSARAPAPIAPHHTMPAVISTSLPLATVLRHEQAPFQDPARSPLCVRRSDAGG